MKKFAFALAAVTLAAAAPAMAATVIDQSQTDNIGGFSYLNQGAITSQSFTAGYDNSVGGGFFLVSGYGSSSNSALVNITLYDGVPQGGGQAIASGSSVGSLDSWVDVSWAQVSLVAGQTYWLAATSDTNLVVSYGYNAYANGNAYYGSSSYDGYSLTFRTYANDAVAAVPEPATWGLMVAGFGMVGFGLRRRAKVSTAVTYA